MTGVRSDEGHGAGRAGDDDVSLYGRLRHDVLDGAFPAGAAMQETTLTTRYGVSRTPIREALVRLAQDGLLERAGRGYRVRSGTPQDVLDIYDARIALEAVAAANAAARRTELELARLERLHEASCRAEDPAVARGLNTQWHETLWLAAHNATVDDVLVRLTAQLRIYDRDRVETADDLATTRTEHGEVMVALRERAPERARQVITAHLERSREVRLRSFSDAVPTEAVELTS